mmetsp:Transcript_37753/g.84162  ORF Transcript_37753/g.84162 Transcript_37753/m.84162 type:complete len:687 (+) Transcript_37753:200-2260(+)
MGAEIRSNQVAPLPLQEGPPKIDTKAPAELAKSPTASPPNKLEPLAGYTPPQVATGGAATPLTASPALPSVPAPPKDLESKTETPSSPLGTGQSVLSDDSHNQELNEDDPHSGLENFIPFRFADLRDQIIADHPDIFSSQDTRIKFHKLCKWLSVRNQVRLSIVFGDADDHYSYMDPDNDEEDPGAGRMTDADKAVCMAKFIQQFVSILDKGDYAAISQEWLDQSYTEQSADGFMGTGMQVKPVNTDIIEFQLWYRGKTHKKTTYRSWRTLWVQKTLSQTMFERLVVMFRRRPQEQIDYLMSLHPRPWYKRAWDKCFALMFGKDGSTLSGGATLQGGYLYLKVFKDVAHTDIDMLLPGAQAKFSWLDYTLIFGSMLVAIGTAIYKAVTGTLVFDTMTAILTSVVLILMPLYGAFRGYMSIKEKMQDLQDHLNTLFILHNISNNTSVISQVLGEAAEQEDKEAMLAYFFLWKGQKSPSAISKDVLDVEVEAYLQKLIERQDLGVKLDFEVMDSIDKLLRMGLLKVVKQEGAAIGTRVLQVLPLDQAVEAADISKFDIKREVVGVRKTKSMASNIHFAGMSAKVDGPVWRECYDVYPSTGQKFRYFWNATTGESTYEPPLEFVPAEEPKTSSSGLPGGPGLASMAVRAPVVPPPPEGPPPAPQGVVDGKRVPAGAADTPAAQAPAMTR